jgi:two-component system, cell cycle response regulator DivK
MQTDDQRPASEPKTVLVVEDNELNLKLFVDLLDYHGYRVVTSTFGRAAINLARQHRPDLILLDIQLPDITGMEVADQLKADENTRRIPLVAVTAFAMSGDRQRVLESGCDDYLAKPFNVREFLSLVERYTSPNPNGTPEQVY